jgi:hypothetical protein
MEKELKNLSYKLKSYGQDNAALSVEELLLSIDKIDRNIFQKTAQSEGGMAGFLGTSTSGEQPVTQQDTAQSEGGMAGFLGTSTSGEQPVAQDSSAQESNEPTEQESLEYEAWKKILADYEKVPGTVKAIEDVAMSVMQKVTSPLSGHHEELEGMGNNPSEGDRRQTVFKIDQIAGGTVKSMEYEDQIEESGNFLHVKKSSHKKIASIDNYIDNHLTNLELNNKDIHSFARLAVDPSDTLRGMEKDVDMLTYKDPITGQTGVGKLTGADVLAKAKPGYFARAMAIVGILFSGPLLVKNLIEAFRNGNSILNKLPLDKYGIPVMGAMTGTSQGKIKGALRRAVKENKDNPEALYEILEILKTISAYWLDAVFAITNAIMLIIDIISAVALYAAPATLGISVVLAGGLGFLISMGLIGVELSAEVLVHGFFEPMKERIKKIAEDNIARLVGSQEDEASPIGKEKPDFSGSKFKAVQEIAELGAKAL